MTGRNHIRTTVQCHFKSAQIIPIEAKESDIRLFIKNKVDENRIQEPDLMDERLEQAIIEKITASSKGMSAAYESSNFQSFNDIR